MRRKTQIAPPRLVETISLDESRNLVTIFDGHPVWAANSTFVWPNLQGAIVKVEPPHEASDAKIAWVTTLVKQLGAVAVKVLPRAPAPLVFGEVSTEQLEQVEKDEASPLPSVQRVISQLIGRSFCENKEGLRAIVDDCINHAEVRNNTVASPYDPGHLVGIRLENWLCFKGEHTIEGLEPIAYSVTAEDAEDAERSNYLGKSSLLHAIVFALTGDYPTDTTDGWISYGADSGGVDLEFSNGLFIGRSKCRGFGTELEISLAPELSSDDPKTYTGAAAQAFLDESVITKERLFKTAYFEQKSTDQFIAMGPTERSDTVNTWLGIDWIQEAADYCRAALNQLCTEQNAIEAKLEEPGLLNACLSDTLRLKEHSAREAKELKGKIANVARLMEDRRTWEEHEKKARTRESLMVEIEKLEGIRESGSDLQERAKAATQLHFQKYAELKEAERVRHDAGKFARGEFDGKCPVAGIECPATATIKNLVDPLRQKEREAIKKVADAKEAERASSIGVERLRGDLAEWERLGREVNRLDALLVEANESADWLRQAEQAELADAISQLGPGATPCDPKSFPGGSADEDSSITEKYEEITEKYEEATRSHADAVSRETSLRAAIETQARLAGDLAALAPQIELYRQAMLVLGRTGVQRVIAEGALAQIEAGGNRAMHQAGIGLQLRVSWAHETKQPAPYCDNCGAEFPKSARVKECARCKSPRGKKLSNELRITLNHRSGGADDLAGVMFKLSAAHWLRAYEQSGWSIFMIDEPFGHLDRAHVRSLSQHLSNLLGKQFGASQSFIVAHHLDILEGAQGRIHITSTNGSSTLKVL